MADNQVARVGEVPSHLLQLMTANPQMSTGLETMKHIRILNRIAVIQSNSPKDKKDKFGESALCVPATDMLLAGKGQAFDFVPVMFFDEFIAWNDRKDVASPMIAESTTDRNSQLAQRCQDPKSWAQPYGPDNKFTRKNNHHLNFLAVVYSGQFKGELVVLSLARSNWKTGEALIGKIRQRKINGTQVPMWATVWSARTVFTKKDDNEWYKVEINSAEVPWVAAEDLKQMQAIYEELLSSFKANDIAVGHEAAERTEEAVTMDDEM